MRHLLAALLLALAGIAFALPYAIVARPSSPMTPYVENCPGEVKQVSLQVGFESVDGMARLVEPGASLRVEGERERTGLAIERVFDSKFGDEIYGLPSTPVKAISVFVRLPADDALHGKKATLVVSSRYEYPSVVETDAFGSGGEFAVLEGEATQEFPFTFEPASRNAQAQAKRYDEEKAEYDRRLPAWRTTESASIVGGALGVLAAVVIEAIGAFRKRR